MMVQNGKSQNTPVTTGIAGENKIEIVSGLAEGDQVIASQVKAQSTSGAQGNKGGGGMIPGMGR